MSDGQVLASMAGIVLCLEALVMGLVLWFYGYRVPLARVGIALVATWVVVFLLGLWVGPRISLVVVLFVVRVGAIRVLCGVEWHEAYRMTRTLGVVEALVVVGLVVWVMCTGQGGFRITPFI